MLVLSNKSVKLGKQFLTFAQQCVALLIGSIKPLGGNAEPGTQDGSFGKQFLSFAHLVITHMYIFASAGQRLPPLPARS